MDSAGDQFLKSGLPDRLVLCSQIIYFFRFLFGAAMSIAPLIALNAMALHERHCPACSKNPSLIMILFVGSAFYAFGWALMCFASRKNHFLEIMNDRVVVTSFVSMFRKASWSIKYYSWTDFDTVELRQDGRSDSLRIYLDGKRASSPLLLRDEYDQSIRDLYEDIRSRWSVARRRPPV